MKLMFLPRPAHHHCQTSRHLPLQDRLLQPNPCDTIGSKGGLAHLHLKSPSNFQLVDQKYPEEGRQLMDHVLTTHAQKGRRIWLEYNHRFRVRGERTGAPWNVFKYPLYARVKAKCKVRAANTSVSSQPYRDDGCTSKRPRHCRYWCAFNKGICPKRECRCVHGCSFCRILNEIQSLIGSLNFACRAKAPGDAFLRHLIGLTRGCSRAKLRVSLTIETRKDISA